MKIIFWHGEIFECFHNSCFALLQTQIQRGQNGRAAQPVVAKQLQNNAVLRRAALSGPKPAAPDRARLGVI